MQNLTVRVSNVRTPLPVGCSIVLESFLVDKKSPTSILLIDGAISGFGDFSGSLNQGWKLGSGVEFVAQSVMYDENLNSKIYATKAVIAGHTTTGPQIMTFRYFSVSSCGQSPFVVYNPNAVDDNRLGQTQSVYTITEIEP